MNKRKKNLLILVLGAIAALGPFSIDMYLPGFPSIARSLRTDIDMVSLTLTSYFIGISVGQLIYGPLIDRFGRKNPLLVGFGIYLAASIGCSLAGGIHSLIVLRLIQALGGCVGMVASRAIIRDQFESREIASVFSTLILVMGVAPIVAPTIGGYVTSHFSWRSIFIILSAFSGLLLIVTWFFLSESKEPDKGVSLKLLTVSKNYLSVLTNRHFFLYGLAGSVTMAGLFAYISGAPFVLMDIYGMTEKTFGWAFGLNACGFIAGSQVNRLLLRRFTEESITFHGSVLIVLVGLILIVGIGIGRFPLLLLLGLLFTLLFLLGIINPNATALALVPFQAKAGVASALIGSFRMLAAAVTSGLISALHNGTEKPMIFLIFSCTVIVFLSLLYLRKTTGDPAQEST